jgi:hypothetical protein
LATLKACQGRVCSNRLLRSTSHTHTAEAARGTQLDLDSCAAQPKTWHVCFGGGESKLPLARWHRATLQAVALPCLRLECCLEVRVVAAKPLSPSKGTYVYV